MIYKDKENTKRKLIEAVGEIFHTQGFREIRISKVARYAGVDRKLVYRYFGNLNNLIEAYIVENDYWMLFSEHLKSLFKEVQLPDNKALITQILQEQFKFFYAEKEMQQLILLELNETNAMMRSIHNARESLGQGLLETTDAHFENTKVNFRAVAALLVGGIYYIVLHTRTNGHKFAGLDLKTDEGMNAIMETIKMIVDWAYQAAG